MQLQCQVQDSCLIIKGGISKSWLEGFYDPTEGGENELEVVYKMGGVMHRIRVADDEEMCIPREEDKMSERERRKWEKEFQLKGMDLVEMKKKRNRRWAAYAIITTAAIGVGVYYYRRNRKQPEGGERNVGWVEGLGGVMGSGGEKVRDIVEYWLGMLSELTIHWISQLPSSEKVVGLGQSLVSTVSPEWLGRSAVS